MKNMKKFILIPLLLFAFAFSVDIDESQDNSVVLTSQAITLEHKEAYKLDDGEYKSAVATKSNFGGESYAGIGLFSMFVALSAFFANNKKRLLEIGGGAALFALAFVNFEAAASLAVFPIVFKQLAPKDDEGGEMSVELKKFAEGMAEKNLTLIKDAIKNEMVALKNGTITAEQLVSKLEALGLKENALKELNEAIVKQGEWMRKQESNSVGKNKDWKSNISKAWGVDGVSEKIVKTFKSGSGRVNIIGGEDEFENKVVGNITTANVTTDTGGNALLDLLNADDIAVMNLRDPWIEDYATVSRTAKPIYTYADYIPGEGDAAFVGEAGLKPQIDLDIAVRTITPKKVAAYEVMSEEAITDIPRLDSESKVLLLKRILLKRQNKILFGAGAGSDPIGVATLANAWDAASWTGDKVTDVNLYDVIVAMANQIYNAHNYTDEAAYYPNLAVMNPADLAALKLKKNEFGMYLFPQFQLVGSQGQSINVDGITILPKRDIPTGKIMMGDFTKLRIINYIDYNVKMGYINDQMIYNLFTMLGESRFYTLIKTLDKKAFIYDDISDVVAGIQAV